MKTLSAILTATLLLAGCSELRPEPQLGDGHITAPEVEPAGASIPAPVRVAPALPEPKPFKKEPTHTVVVHDVPVEELLFTLARDAKLNLDMTDDVKGKISLNAINQPLAVILERVTESAGLRYSLKDDRLVIKKDLPYWKNYRVDYLNLSRLSRSSVSVATEIRSTGQGAGDESAGGANNNNSETEVKNLSEHAFWDTLQKNIAAVLNEGKASMDTESGSHPDIMLNRESGLIGIRANSRKQQAIQTFLDEVLMSSQRQVLIEATIAEVKLSDSYQAGIDWSIVKNGSNTSTNLTQTLTDLDLFDRPNFAMTLIDNDFSGNQIQGTLRALEQFGDVKIMSSPKVMAMNNQTAMLKVVDNLVYFSIEVFIERGDSNSDTLVTYETEIQTVPVGFVMSVTPYINEHDTVTLNVRPTISRVIGYKRDPNPALASVNTISEIPEIQVREVESVLKVNSGDVAVIGGLMQDEINNNSAGVPVLSKLPILGSLFRYESDKTEKTELVIFIKPVVIKHASVETDMAEYRRYLPEAE